MFDFFILHPSDNGFEAQQENAKRDRATELEEIAARKKLKLHHLQQAEAAQTDTGV